jgi:E3 ubiquitin-protein ligase TRIP12
MLDGYNRDKSATSRRGDESVDPQLDDNMSGSSTIDDGDTDHGQGQDYDRDEELESLSRLSEAVQRRMAARTTLTQMIDEMSFDDEYDFEDSHDLSDDRVLNNLDTFDLLRRLNGATAGRTNRQGLEIHQDIAFQNKDHDLHNHEHRHNQDDDDDDEEDEENDDDDDAGDAEPDAEPHDEHDDQDDLDEQDNENDDDDDDDINSDDPRTVFLRAIGALSGNPNRDGRGQGFVDAVQRLIGGGIFEGGNSNRDNGEMNGLIDNLNQREDTYIILETLNELSERLLMMNGITAERIIPANKLAKALIFIMDDPRLIGELEVHLVACRCLYNFLEVNQDFIHDALHNNAIEALCKKLMEISYIDLTEQALQTLEMISRDPISHKQIVANNGLKACLQYLDFLTIHAQRKCLTIVANACTNLSIANFEMVKSLINNIAEVIRNHHDSNIVESGWLAISRIITSYKFKPNFIEELFLENTGILEEITNILYISVNKSQNEDLSKTAVSYSTVLSLLKSTIVLTSVSVKISRIFLEDCRIGKVIVKSISKYGKSKIENPEDISIEALMAAPNELLVQCLNLIGSLLPITYTSNESPFILNESINCEEKAAVDISRVQLFEEIDFWEFANDIWCLLINSFEETMDFEIRKKVFINLLRILSFMGENESDKIKDFQKISNILLPIINMGRRVMSKELMNVELVDEDIEMKNSAEDGVSIENYESNEKDSSSLAEINTNMLLLASFSITSIVMKKVKTDIIQIFEREGLIDDIKYIKDLLKEKVSTSSTPDPSRIPGTSLSNFSNKFIDVELSSSHQQKLTNSKILSRLVEIGGEICELHNSRQCNTESDTVSEHLGLLIEFVNFFPDHKFESYGFVDWQQTWQRLYELLANTNENTRVSSFELNSSGLIKILANFFKDSEKNFESSICQEAFTSVFYSNEKGRSVLSFLVSKLQEALIRSESFEIVTTGASDMSNRSVYRTQDVSTASMAKQVKLRLIAEGDAKEKVPPNMQNVVLSVHAIATFMTIGSFLEQRLKFMDDFNGIIEGASFANQLIDSNTKNNQRTSEVKPEESQVSFTINGEAIPMGITIYGALYRSLQHKAEEIVDPSNIWRATHEVRYKLDTGSPSTEEKILSYEVNSEPKDLDFYDHTTIETLYVLKAIHQINLFVKFQNMNGLDDSIFMNWKLTVKLNRQLEEPLVIASGTLPGWSIHVTRNFPFIFPLGTRIFFLQSTSFGYSRLIHQWQIRTNQLEDDNNTSTTNRDYNQRPQLGRATRHKVRLSRNMILQSAIKVLGLYGSTPGILEIEYFNEVGSGLGPTLEFYSTVSKEFAKKKLRLWRDNGSIHNDNEEYSFSNFGLFPAPLDKHQIKSINGKKVSNLYSALGTFIARALLDSRIIDFNFNPIFLKLIQFFNHADKCDKEIKKLVTIANLRNVDTKLASSIEHLMKYTERFGIVSPSERDEITIDGATLQDLELYYELPGYPDYELIPGGSEIQINASNIENYIKDIVDATLYSGIVHQIQTFMDGFSKVFPINSLVIFSPKELVELFGNAAEDWSTNTLTSSINANHGYTKDSEAIRNLIEILVNFEESEKRAFLQFLTGAPKLPVGGFKSLRPELTVVRKSAEDGFKDDDYLPSVMTCANYLKLPNYSSPEIMRKKLLQAINEGAGAFLLS